MADSLNTSYREILQNENVTLRCRELSIGTGSASGRTWESFHTKSGGGYAYKSSGSAGSSCRNRFIYWKVNADTLELTEISLDFTLTSNSVRFRFQDSALLADVSVHESHGNVVVLVSTTCSVHRLLFPHPSRLQQKDQAIVSGSDRSQASIFTDTSMMRTQDPAHSHFLEAAGTTYNVLTASSWLTPEGNALFALALTSGVVQLIQLPPLGSSGEVAVLELKHSSVMQRLWTGLVPQLFRGADGEADTPQALLLHPLGNDTFLFTLCRDLKLRMWSCSGGECIMACDMMDFIPNSSAMKKTGPPAGSKYILRKCVTSSSQSMNLGVFLSFLDKCQFCFFEPVSTGGRYQLRHISTLFGPQEDLVDFGMCPDLVWTLWNTPQGETVSRLAHMSCLTKGADRWSSVHSDAPLPLQVMVPDHLDPRQCHMDEIFTPGRFTTQAILKAINIFRRALDTTHLPESVVPLNALRSEVAAVVEYEIQRSASEYEMSHEEYMALQAQQWAKFYSCLVQYQHRGHQALGLMVDGSTGMVAMVRKEAVGYLRPCQTTEHMYLSPLSGGLANQIQILASLTEDGALCDDLAKLMGCLCMLRDSLPQFSLFCLEQDLFYLQDPVQIANTVISEFLADPDQIDQMWEKCLSRLRLFEDFVQSIEAVIHLLDLAQSSVGSDSDEAEPARQLGVHRLFTSQQGVALICEAVSQMVRSRFDMAEDLLLTLTLILQLGDQTGMSVSILEQIKCDLLPRTATLVQAYHLLNWLCRTQATPVSAAQRESSLRQQEILGISAKGCNIPMRFSGDQHCTLLELFMSSYGGDLVREELQRCAVFDEDPCTVWDEALVPTILAVGQQIWPYSSFMLPEFLLIHCQYTALQEYVRLSQWCELNGASRRFLLGVSHLNSNESNKAYNCFVEATLGASQEDFLLEVARPGASSGDVVNTRVLYYLKVLGLLEMFSEPLHVIELAKTAISIAEPDDPNLATLWSIIFKHELALGHNQAAYNTMLANTDSSRRKDCLREFLVVLCERSELQTLVELPYRDRHVVLEDEVVSILESRARAIDLNHHNYYQLLYAFHVFRSNYRKAGSIMYEYGMRLGRECAGLKGLQRQAKAYLAALNALRLVDEKNAWIVKPMMNPLDQDDDSQNVQSSKDRYGVPPPVKRSIEVLELEAIEREYILVHARLQLLQLDPDPSHMAGPTASANETLSLLVNAGLMDSAVNICKMFDLSMVPIFEGLAARCVQLAENSDGYMQSDNDYTSDAWKWLKQNELPSSTAARDSSSTEHAWRMLHSYLSQYGSQSTAYHCCVLTCILSQGFPLPDWLVASYKRVNSSELLRLYLDYDLLEEASTLVHEMLDSVCGKGKEYFGLKTFLHTGTPAVWLPYTAMDQLLLALRDVRTEPHYTELFHALNERLDKYFGLVEDISQQTTEASRSSARWNY